MRRICAGSGLCLAGGEGKAFAEQSLDPGGSAFSCGEKRRDFLGFPPLEGGGAWKRFTAVIFPSRGNGMNNFGKK